MGDTVSLDFAVFLRCMFVDNVANEQWPVAKLARLRTVSHCWRRAVAAILEEYLCAQLVGVPPVMNSQTLLERLHRYDAATASADVCALSRHNWLSELTDDGECKNPVAAAVCHGYSTAAVECLAAVCPLYKVAVGIAASPDADVAHALCAVFASRCPDDAVPAKRLYVAGVLNCPCLSPDDKRKLLQRLPLKPIQYVQVFRYVAGTITCTTGGVATPHRRQDAINSTTVNGDLVALCTLSTQSAEVLYDAAGEYVWSRGLDETMDALVAAARSHDDTWLLHMLQHAPPKTEEALDWVSECFSREAPGPGVNMVLEHVARCRNLRDSVQ